ncbi:MAG: 6-phosphogluconolactonase [Clostridia bacterium]|nr:6-phosphogluconolactonase [Clostridia bacterium]
MSILVYRDKATACAAAATLVSAGVIEKPNTVLGLDWAPELQPVYRTLARMTSDGLLDWSEVKSFNLYEHVHADSERLCETQLLSVLYDRVNIAPENRFMPNTTGHDWSVVCNDYENAILNAGGLDTVLCAARADGSVAYNLGAQELAPVTHVERTESGRIVTVGMTTLMSAKRMVVAILGRDKADIAAMICNGSITPSVPASYLQMHANAVFILDEDAAEKL